MKSIMPCLWFEDKAEEAARYYTSLFKDSKINSISHYGPAASKASGRPAGSVMAVMFELNGMEFMALNGGPEFKFTEAISLVVRCKNQKEIDEFWDKLSRDGTPSVCGWLKDKYGLSWQIIPESLDKLIADPAKSDRVMEAVVRMKKLDIKTLEDAYEGKVTAGAR